MKYHLLPTLFLSFTPLYLVAETPATSTAHAPANPYNITFHESWSEQHRTDLARLYRLMRTDVAEAAIRSSKMNVGVSVDADAASTAEEIAAQISEKMEAQIEKAKQNTTLAERMVARATTRPMRNLIKKTAACGRGDVYDEDGLCVAYLAIRLGMTELAKELVRRGTNPNQKLRIGTDTVHEGAVYENLLCTAVAQSYMCETARPTPEQAEDMVRWLLENGDDPNEGDIEMLCLCCCMEMVFANRCTCTALVLDRLNSLSTAQQEQLATAILSHIEGSWDTFEHFYNKGLFTHQALEHHVSIFSAISLHITPDAPLKTEKLLALGFNPNYVPNLTRQDFADDEEYEEYLDEYGTARPPLATHIMRLTPFFTEEESQRQTLLQCIEILLRHGATAKVYESDLPEDTAMREKVTALLEQYKVPILPEEEDTE